MFKHILIPTDGSDLSIGAVRQGVKYAKESGASNTVLTVTPPFNAFELGAMLPLRDPEEHRKLAEEQASRRLAAAGEIARGANVPCETVHVEHDRPYQAIIETARARDCDLILLASHGWRGLAAVLLGSETTKVLTHSTVPVLVVR
jgi:nucleotide-binding universal stress UspA family protein